MLLQSKGCISLLQIKYVVSSTCKMCIWADIFFSLSSLWWWNQIFSTPIVVKRHSSCPLCALARVCPIGCVWRSVPRDSGATAGVARGATPPARAAPGAGATSALPVNLVTTWLRGPTPAQPSVGTTTTSTTVGFLAWKPYFTLFVGVINTAREIPSSEPLRTHGSPKSCLDPAVHAC